MTRLLRLWQLRLRGEEKTVEIGVLASRRTYLLPPADADLHGRMLQERHFVSPRATKFEYSDIPPPNAPIM